MYACSAKNELGLVKFLRIVFLYLISIDAVAQVIPGSVSIDGKTVEMQKLTMQCPTIDIRTGGLSGTTKLTIHMIDTKNLRDTGNVRVEANGWYDWKEKIWKKFQSIEENHITLYEEAVGSVSRTSTQTVQRYNPVFTGSGVVSVPYSSSETRTRTLDESCYSWLARINRNNMFMEYVGTRNVPNDTARSSYECTTSVPFRNLTGGGVCQVLSYEAPPQRIGF